MATEHTPTATVAVDRFGYLTTGNLLIDRKARRLINTLVEEKFRNEVDAWAAADSGTLRTRLAIRLELARELETLFVALGPWALVPSSEIFPADEFFPGQWGL